jgi:hypothetical protein
MVPEKRGIRAGPMAEGLIPLTKSGRRAWEAMSDEDIEAYARGFIRAKRISTLAELRDADEGLRDSLARRGMLGPKFWERAGLAGKRRAWKMLSDAELLSHARSFMESSGITSMRELREADAGLYQELLKREKGGRGILQKASFISRKRRWNSYSDSELVSFARTFMEKKGIAGIKELKEAHERLYRALIDRKGKCPEIMEKVGFLAKKSRRNWDVFNDKELAAVGKHMIMFKRIRSRSELHGFDKSLFQALSRRRLMDGVFSGFEAIREEEVREQLRRAIDMYAARKPPRMVSLNRL